MKYGLVCNIYIFFFSFFLQADKTASLTKPALPDGVDCSQIAVTLLQGNLPQLSDKRWEYSSDHHNLNKHDWLGDIIFERMHIYIFFMIEWDSKTALQYCTMSYFWHWS